MTRGSHPVVAIAIDVRVVDADALHAAARERSMAHGNDDAETTTWLGSADRPDLAACVAALHDAHGPDSGLGVLRVEARCDGPTTPVLRETRIVNAWTGNLKPDELDEITALFDPSVLPTGVSRCLDDATHRGLHMSPKYAGFIVRLSDAEWWADIRADHTPEMAALVDAAMRQGAHRIEFDADEEPADGFHAE